MKLNIFLQSQGFINKMRSANTVTSFQLVEWEFIGIIAPEIETKDFL